MTEYRIKVLHDEFNFGGCPLSWSGDDYAVVSLESYYRMICLTIEGNLVDTVTRTALENALNGAYDDDAFYSAAVRHFQRQGYLVTERIWRGYSQGDYKRYILAIDMNNEAGSGCIDAEAERYERWLAGDVYGVILERLTRWTGEFGDADERWDAVPDCAIWGCYLDSDYTALDVARDYFDVELPDDVEVIYT